MNFRDETEGSYILLDIVQTYNGRIVKNMFFSSVWKKMDMKGKTTGSRQCERGGAGH